MKACVTLKKILQGGPGGGVKRRCINVNWPPSLSLFLPNKVDQYFEKYFSFRLSFPHIKAHEKYVRFYQSIRNLTPRFCNNKVIQSPNDKQKMDIWFLEVFRKCQWIWKRNSSYSVPLSIDLLMISEDYRYVIMQMMQRKKFHEIGFCMN